MAYLLSLCIPTYNRAPYLKSLLESILPQLTPQVEVVISDNGSTDNTKDLIATFADKIPSLAYFSLRENQGPDRNFLHVVERAQGQFCWLLGSDDALYPGAVARLLEEIRHATADLFLLRKNSYDSHMSHRVLAYEPMGHYGDTTTNDEKSQHKEFFCRVASNLGYLGGLAFRRSLWQSVDAASFIGTAYVHVFIIQHLLKAGYPLKYLSTPAIKWRADNDSILTTWTADPSLRRKAFLRLQIELGYLDITKKVFGNTSKTLRYVTHDLAKGNLFYQLLKYKLDGTYHTAMLRSLFSYTKKSPYFYTRIVPLALMPKILLSAAKVLYRATYKKSQLAKLKTDKCSC